MRSACFREGLSRGKRWLDDCPPIGPNLEALAELGLEGLRRSIPSRSESGGTRRGVICPHCGERPAMFAAAFRSETGASLRRSSGFGKQFLAKSAEQKPNSGGNSNNFIVLESGRFHKGNRTDGQWTSPFNSTVCSGFGREETSSYLDSYGDNENGKFQAQDAAPSYAHWHDNVAVAAGFVG